MDGKREEKKEGGGRRDEVRWKEDGGVCRKGGLGVGGLEG